MVWYKEKCYVTVSTMYNTLGFRGRKELKMHFDEFVHKKGPRLHDEETQMKLDHENKNEIYKYRHWLFKCKLTLTYNFLLTMTFT